VIATAFPPGVLGSDALLETGCKVPRPALAAALSRLAAADHLLGAVLVALQGAAPPAVVVGMVAVVHEIARSLSSMVGRAITLVTG
jgi:Ca2+/Na+ antiporter